MPTFTVSKPYTMPKEKVRAAVEQLAEQLEARYGARARWSGDVVSIKGSGMEGHLDFADDCIDVTVRLGLLGAAFESKLKKGIQHYLDSYVT